LYILSPLGERQTVAMIFFNGHQSSCNGRYSYHSFYLHSSCHRPIHDDFTYDRTFSRRYPKVYILRLYGCAAVRWNPSREFQFIINRFPVTFRKCVQSLCGVWHNSVETSPIYIWSDERAARGLCAGKLEKGRTYSPYIPVSYFIQYPSIIVPCILNILHSSTRLRKFK